MRFLSLLCCDANPSALMFFLSQVTPEDKGKATRLHSQDNVKDMSEAKAHDMTTIFKKCQLRLPGARICPVI